MLVHNGHGVNKTTTPNAIKAVIKQIIQKLMILCQLVFISVLSIYLDACSNLIGICLDNDNYNQCYGFCDKSGTACPI